MEGLQLAMANFISSRKEGYLLPLVNCEALLQDTAPPQPYSPALAIWKTIHDIVTFSCLVFLML